MCRSNPTGFFVQIPNATLNDYRLSLKARGLLANMLNKAPDWKFSKRRIAIENGVSVGTVRRAMEELMELGYVRPIGQPNENGFGEMDYAVYDTPMVRNAPPLIDTTINTKL